jgi:hypothetical protein
MKKSSSVALLFLPTLAAVALANGCGSGAVSRACVDNAQNIVSQGYCENERRDHPAGPYNYHWYYYQGNYAPSSGHASGGSFFAPEGSSFAPHESVGSISRGGFGEIGSGHASGGE